MPATAGPASSSCDRGHLAAGLPAADSCRVFAMMVASLPSGCRMMRAQFAAPTRERSWRIRPASVDPWQTGLVGSLSFVRGQHPKRFLFTKVDQDKKEAEELRGLLEKLVAIPNEIERDSCIGYSRWFHWLSRQYAADQASEGLGNYRL